MHQQLSCLPKLLTGDILNFLLLKKPGSHICWGWISPLWQGAVWRYLPPMSDPTFMAVWASHIAEELWSEPSFGWKLTLNPGGSGSSPQHLCVCIQHQHFWVTYLNKMMTIYFLLHIWQNKTNHPDNSSISPRDLQELPARTINPFMDLWPHSYLVISK